MYRDNYGRLSTVVSLYARLDVSRRRRIVWQLIEFRRERPYRESRRISAHTERKLVQYEKKGKTRRPGPEVRDRDSRFAYAAAAGTKRENDGAPAGRRGTDLFGRVDGKKNQKKKKTINASTSR